MYYSEEETMVLGAVAGSLLLAGRHSTPGVMHSNTDGNMTMNSAVSANSAVTMDSDNDRSMNSDKKTHDMHSAPTKLGAAIEAQAAQRAAAQKPGIVESLFKSFTS